MSVSSFLGLDPVGERIRERYGTRSNEIINATGTGTQLVLSVYNKDEVDDYLDDIFDGEDGYLYITAFSPNGISFRSQQQNIMGTKRTLRGYNIPFAKAASVELDVAVIGNSLDYYKLAMLANIYMNHARPQRIAKHSPLPILEGKIVSASAPGANVILVDGYMTDAEPIMGLDGNSRISDRVFHFSFERSTSPSWSAQGYDSTKAGWLATTANNLLGM